MVLKLHQVNTHSRASLRTAFRLAEAKRIADNLEIHFTPKHGGWLNMAELEVGILRRQCLDQRFADRGAMEHTVRVGVAARNAVMHRIDWQFTTSDARTKFRLLYPALEE